MSNETSTFNIGVASSDEQTTASGTAGSIPSSATTGGSGGMDSLLALLQQMNESQKRMEEKQQIRDAKMDEMKEEQRIRDGEMKQELRARDEKFEALLQSQRMETRLLKDSVANVEQEVNNLKTDVQLQYDAVQQQFSSVQQQQQRLRDEFTREIQAVENRVRHQTVVQSPHLESSHHASMAVNDGSFRHVRDADRVKAPVYDGRSCWEAFLRQFEIVARINGWTDEDMSQRLLTALRGSATAVLQNLTDDLLNDYGRLKQTLSTRFGSQGQPEIARVRLRNRVQRRDEKLVELAEDIERLTRLAYPDTPEATLSSFAAERFIDALRQETIKQQVLIARPSSLQQALQIALQMESVLCNLRSDSRIVRRVDAADEQPTSSAVNAVSVKSYGSKNSDVEHLLKENFQKLFKLIEGHQAKKFAQTDKRELVCWNCQKPGHLRTRCPSVKSEQLKE